MPRLILENEFYWESREGRGAGEGIEGEGKDGFEGANCGHKDNPFVKVYKQFYKHKCGV